MARLRPQMSREPEILEGNVPGGSFGVTLYPGTGRPASEVELRSTDITPYLIDPSLAQMEADVTQARYGGTTIQQSPGGTPPMVPYERPQQGAAAPQQIDYSNRTAFEQNVFQQIGGNPFEINPIEAVDMISQKMEANLFRQIFGNHILWEDKDRMSTQQAQHWQNELNAFRADLKERVEADKKTKIDVYNNIMKRFDNDAKEQEAARKRVEARNKEFLAQQRGRESDVSTLNKEKAGLLKRLTEISVEGFGVDVEQTADQKAELDNVRQRIKEINQQIINLKAAGKPSLKPKSDFTAPATQKPGSQPKKGKLAQDVEYVQKRYFEMRKKGMTPAQIQSELAKEGIELS